jgi:hypothetical protein
LYRRLGCCLDLDVELHLTRPPRSPCSAPALASRVCQGQRTPVGAERADLRHRASGQSALIGWGSPGAEEQRVVRRYAWRSSEARRRWGRELIESFSWQCRVNIFNIFSLPNLPSIYTPFS